MRACPCNSSAPRRAQSRAPPLFRSSMQQTRRPENDGRMSGLGCERFALGGFSSAGDNMRDRRGVAPRTALPLQAPTSEPAFFPRAR
jgi:hypothetical protein